ncbi:MAG: phage tail protein [Oscillospiraceae bacterium]|nr:phage tail protein [Oscillospiraceae bacterium]
MAVVGHLGDVVFQVSEDVLETLSDFEWSGTARYAVHQRHGGNALTEFLGVEPDKIRFSMMLVRELGVDIVTELVKLWNMERSGEAVGMSIGDKGYGKYRWNLVKHDIKYTHHDAAGNPIVAEVAVELQEYLRS